VTPPRPDLASWIEADFAGASLSPMTGDASTRRFFRLTLPDGATLVVMDYGAPFEGETDDVTVGGLFRQAGLPVAALIDVRPQPGCLLLEDLGDVTLERGLGGADAAARERMVEQAVDLAADVAVRGTPVLRESTRAAGPALDGERFRFEMEFFLQHFVGGLRGITPPAALVRGLRDLADLAARTDAPVLCHRDFHSRNLMLRPDGSLAMVDIQDARWGPDGYDVASLLCDAYVDLDEALAERLLARYRARVPGLAEDGDFRRRYDVVAAERMIKALGTFGYQATVRGREHYLERTLDRLRRRLPGRPETAAIGRLLDDLGLLQT
jgi:aminoglycoside/choline kinase family phosphotransferase